ncbi:MULTISPECIES: hypothetical protein [Pseudomonas]|uniref:hypothetical protein n=1 Tax=Pseudomonas TaxID=286 RepID=UPI002147CDD5|nr:MULTISPECIES: hypothetical protein [Pseudomonas]UUT20962.1 hypothetical protein NRG23_25100 [Pseudomonas sp. T8]WJV24121.1 hypothetical protein PSR66_31635 [Pseudomonas chlororaphis]
MNKIRVHDRLEELAYFPEEGGSLSFYLSPKDSLVISRDFEGQVISYFIDDVWDMRVYDAKNKCVYSFSSWSKTDSPLKTIIIREMKIAQLARLYLSGAPRRVASVRLILLRKLARLALSNSTTLTNLLNDSNYHTSIITSFAALTPDSMKSLITVFKELFAIRTRHNEFTIAPPSHLLDKLELIYNKYPKAKQNTPLQTKLMPSRIYGELINGLSKILDEFNLHSAQIEEFHKTRLTTYGYAVPEAHSNRSQNIISWNQAVSHNGLARLFEGLSIRNWKELAMYIGEVQAAAKYWIHLFSGMRDNEANFLPSDTYASIDSGTASFKILKGYTSKIAAQNHTPTFWVTHEIIEKGINAAKIIGTISAFMCGWDDRNKLQYPLFAGRVARKHNAGSSNKNTWHFEGAPVAGSICQTALSRLLKKIPTLCICESDIRELELFDGFRDWRSDPDLALGAPWPLATHQCRRSLAVYGARSGMLSLGSSALQFKQLTEAMASYYRKDSIFSVNFLQSDEAQNWMGELEHERRAAQFFNYDNDIIKTSNRLWGGEGNRIQQARDKGRPLIITTDRQLTEHKFIKGEMVYKNGPIGGCTNLDHCDKISFTSIFGCVDCEKSILDDDRSLKKIKKGINNLVRAKELYPSNAPQFSQLESEISSLYEKLERRGLRKKMEEIE